MKLERHGKHTSSDKVEKDYQQLLYVDCEPEFGIDLHFFIGGLRFFQLLSRKNKYLAHAHVHLILLNLVLHTI